MTEKTMQYQPDQWPTITLPDEPLPSRIAGLELLRAASDSVSEMSNFSKDLESSRTPSVSDELADLNLFAKPAIQTPRAALHTAAAILKQVQAIPSRGNAEEDGRAPTHPPVLKMLHCRACGMQTSASAKYCGGCGAVIQAAATENPALVHCQTCGSRFNPHAKFCGNCGSRAGA